MRMKIPNVVVIALLASFALARSLALPLETFAWRWLHLPVVLAVGFLLFARRVFTGGNARFIVAIAPFVAPEDAAAFLGLTTLVLLVVWLGTGWCCR